MFAPLKHAPLLHHECFLFRSSASRRIFLTPYVRRKCRPQFKYRVYDVSFSPPPLFAQTGRHRQQGRRRESPSSLASKFICLRGPSFLSLLPFSLSFFFSPSFPLAYRASLLRPVNITLPSNLHNYRNL